MASKMVPQHEICCLIQYTDSHLHYITKCGQVMQWLQRQTCDSKSCGFKSQLLHSQVTPWANCSHTCFCHQSVLFSTSQGVVIPCSWEGNRRSGITPAMCCRLHWFIHLWAQGLRKGDEHILHLYSHYLYTHFLTTSLK